MDGIYLAVIALVGNRKMNVIMTGLSSPNDIVELVANYCQATDDFFNKLYNILKNFFTFGQCSGS